MQGTSDPLLSEIRKRDVFLLEMSLLLCSCILSDVFKMFDFMNSNIYYLLTFAVFVDVQLFNHIQIQ